MAAKQSITRWNLLALTVVVLGTVTTLGVDHLWLGYWINSGVQVPVGSRATVPLNPGPVVVYYESMDSVPQANMARLHVLSPSGASLPVLPVGESDSYNMQRHGWSGRPLWYMTVHEPGVYDIGAYNMHYHSDADTPLGDRVVIGKSPDTLSDALTIRNIIRTSGVSLTLLLTVVLYAAHMRTLRAMNDE